MTFVRKPRAFYVDEIDGSNQIHWRPLARARGGSCPWASADFFPVEDNIFQGGGKNILFALKMPKFILFSVKKVQGMWALALPSPADAHDLAFLRRANCIFWCFLFKEYFPPPTLPGKKSPGAYIHSRKIIICEYQYPLFERLAA